MSRITNSFVFWVILLLGGIALSAATFGFIAVGQFRNALIMAVPSGLFAWGFCRMNKNQK